MKNLVIDLEMILFLVGILLVPARADSEEREKIAQQIDTRLKGYSNKDRLPPPYISLTLRITAPDLIKKVENIYFSALDYRFLSLRSLHHAEDFLNEGDISKANKYIEKADRYYKLAIAIWKDSLAVLDSTYSAAEWIVVYKASRTALGFTTVGLGVAAAAFDTAILYTDYLLDKSMMPLEEARKNLIAKAISNALLRFTGISEVVGDMVKHGWGSSRVYPVLQKIMGSSEFKDAVLKEFMRLGGDVGDYAARKMIEEVLESIVKGSIEEKPGEEISVEGGLVTALVMDKSGSMSGKKIEEAKEAAYIYINTSEEQKDMVSIAAFSSNAESITEPIAISEGRELLKKDILSLSAGGSTNVGSGLTVALAHLSSCDRKDRKAFLMSDGRHNAGTYKPEVSEYQKRGWPIWTMAFGRDADQEMLKWIADQTGGMFLQTDLSNIGSGYHKVNVQAHNGSVYRSYNDFIQSGQELTYNIPVQPDMKKVGFFTNWQGSTMNTTLISPSRTVINRSNIDRWGRFVGGKTHSLYEINNPQCGPWEVLITGQGLPPKGEQINFHSYCYSNVFSNALGFQPQYSLNEKVQMGVKLAEVINGRLSPLKGIQVMAEVKKPSMSLQKVALDINRGFDAKTISQIFREVSSRTRKITLFDDGLHQDVKSGDGIYANTYAGATINGPYLVNIDCQGNTSQGIPINRTLQESFQVGPIEQNSFTISDFLGLINQQGIGRQIPIQQPRRTKEQQTQKIVESLLNQFLKKKR